MFEACEKHIDDTNNYKYWPLCPHCGRSLYWNKMFETWECLNIAYANGRYEVSIPDIKKAKKITTDEYVETGNVLKKSISDNAETVDWPGSVDGGN